MLPSDAWLLKIETDSILIKEKRKHLSKTSDRVMKRKRLSLKKEKSIHRSIYRYTKVNSLSYISPVVWGVLERESKSDRGDV